MWKHIIYLGGAAGSVIAPALSGLMVKSLSEMWVDIFRSMVGDKPLPALTTWFLNHGHLIANFIFLAALLVGAAHVFILAKLKRSENRDFAWGSVCLLALFIALLTLASLLLGLTMPMLSITWGMSYPTP